jgi:nucleoid DNA-binding protein
MSIPENTTAAAKAISKKRGIPTQAVRDILDDYVNHIRDALSNEIPFTVTSLCKFYHKYTKANSTVIKNTSQVIMPDGSNFYEGKARKSVKCKLITSAATTLEGWVHDLGVATNQANELLKIQIKPSEIEKIRRRKTLDEQRSLGFRSDLLFDETPAVDAIVENKLGPIPTIEDIAKRIGINLGD